MFDRLRVRPAVCAQTAALVAPYLIHRTDQVFGGARHPLIVYDYTPTRSRASPAEFLEGCTGYLQADAYSVYDAFFKPARGMTEVGCWMHAHRYFYKALESDEPQMGPALHLIARLWLWRSAPSAVTFCRPTAGIAPAGIGATARQATRISAGVQPEVLPKSPSGAAVHYALNQWEALTRFLKDGELEIDNVARERANRDIALGRGNWTFVGSDGGGKTAAVLRSFIATCKRCGVEPFAWLVAYSLASRRIPSPGSIITSHNWQPASSPAQA